MIPQEKVQEIERLLIESRLAQRRIADIMGVSRGTVNAIYRGNFRRQPRSQPPKSPEPQPPPQRCHTCGAMVQMPCTACRVRAIMARRRGKSRPTHGSSSCSAGA